MFIMFQHSFSEVSIDLLSTKDPPLSTLRGPNSQRGELRDSGHTVAMVVRCSKKKMQKISNWEVSMGTHYPRLDMVTKVV
jgi:hypothetical protein